MGKRDAFVKHQCNECLRETKHRVRASYSVKLDWNDGEAERDGWESYVDFWRSDEETGEDVPCRKRADTYEVLECCGCGTVSFLHRQTYEPFGDEAKANADCESISGRTRYPPAKRWAEPRWIRKCPESIQSLLKEIYVAYSADARALAAMGLRSIIDAVCIDKVGDCGRFQRKLEALVAGEFISSYQKDILDAALDAGSAATHRAHIPNAEELSTIMDIAENLLQTTYDLRKRAETLRESTPKRRKPASPDGDNGQADPR
ncbi:MAG: DUF4145 domain-containing protein [Phycisphaerae bacterium]